MASPGSWYWQSQCLVLTHFLTHGILLAVSSQCAREKGVFWGLSPKATNPIREGFTLRVFLGGAVAKNPTANAGDTGDVSLIPGSGRSPRRRKWQPTPVFLHGLSHGQRSLVGYSPWGLKELDITEHIRNIPKDPSSKCHHTGC